MAELETLVVKIQLDTTEFVKAMDEATEATLRLGDAMFRLLAWWARAYLTVRHPVQAWRRWQRTHAIEVKNGD